MFNKLVHSVTDDLMKKGAFEKYAISNFSNEDLRISKTKFREELANIVAENFSEMAGIGPEGDPYIVERAEHAVDSASTAVKDGLSSTLASASDFTTATVGQLNEAWNDVKLTATNASDAVEKFAKDFKVNSEKEISQFIQFMESKGTEVGEAAKQMFNKSSNSVNTFVSENKTPLIGAGAGAAGLAAGLVGAKLSEKKSKGSPKNFSNTTTTPARPVNSRDSWAETLGFSATALTKADEVSPENFSNINNNWMTFINK